MYTPRGFLPSEIDSSLLSDGIAEAFSRFAAELLVHDFASFRRFPTGGRDGAIDFVAEREGRRIVGDFKYLTSGSLASIRQAWKKVRHTLDRHLGGETTAHAQRQYDPWFDSERPIGTYLIVVSSSIKNLQNADAIADDATDFFRRLSERPPLRHLSSMTVELVDWTDLEARLVGRASTLLRWFPKTRPLGLIPLSDSVGGNSFRSYLRSEELPYYSRARHRSMHPTVSPDDVPDEVALVDRLDFQRTTGLVITGAGGYGKTRLALEIARVAERSGWLSLRAVGQVSAGLVEVLGQRLQPDVPTLLVVDYIETQSGFPEMVEALNALNDSFGMKVAYVANCRTSHYSVVSGLPRHDRIDLAPPIGRSNAEWERGYREAVVREVLERGAMRRDSRALQTCRDLPVLAVFLLYLSERDRKPELESLLREQDFGQWVSRRVQASFGSASVTRLLATLLCLLPIPVASSDQLTELERRVLDRLATDGWIEQESGSAYRHWVAAHDVIVDRVVLSYVDSVRNTASSFVDDVFAAAERVGTTRSALVTMQRIGPETPFHGDSWRVALARCLARAPGSWRPARAELISTSLLSLAERLALLRDYPDFWESAERDPNFQIRLGRECRRVLNHEVAGLPTDLSDVLTDWVVRSAYAARSSNYVLTWGLKFAPDQIDGAAREWLSARPSAFQSHYLMVSWLECRRDVDFIRPLVGMWLARHASALHASFLISAWLDSGGALELVRGAAAAWCRRHHGARHSSFVCVAWLKAGGEVDVVREPVITWLREYGTENDASYVLTAWLGAGGGICDVRDAVLDWIKLHEQELDASFLYVAWLKAGGDLREVQRPLLNWLREHNASLSAQYVYTAWLDSGGALSEVREAILSWLQCHESAIDAQFVFTAWLDAGGIATEVRDQLLRWLAIHPYATGNDFLCRAWLEAGQDWKDIESYARSWLHEHRDEWETTHLLKLVTKQSSLPPETVADVVHWCTRFASDEDATWRLGALIEYNGVGGASAEDLIGAAETVLRERITNPGLGLEESSSIDMLIVLVAALDSVDARVFPRVLRLIALWVRNPACFRVNSAHRTFRVAPVVSAIVTLLSVGALNEETDSPAFDRFDQWLAAQESHASKRARTRLRILRRSRGMRESEGSDESTSR
jgi:hypothetical protein